MGNYSDFFVVLTRHGKPHGWQEQLAGQDISNRLIRIPTGFGKTQGVLAAWLWNRCQQQEDQWPRRLVWCLPMRVLVEQTYHECRAILQRLAILWDGTAGHEGKIGVHLLMGGADSGEWHLYPEECAVLIGTQDMLLSRAMNRGYGSPRARWPMEFGLLNQDCLWVMDEVQLMDVGLATSGQIQAFRDDDGQAGKSMRSCYTWWMSATVQRNWLGKSTETKALVDDEGKLPQTGIQAEKRTGHLWDDVAKPCTVVNTIRNSAAFAQMVMDEHLAGGRGKDGPTLVVVNRVETAVELYEKLQKLTPKAGGGQIDLRLVHSRFRAHERKSWREDFLNQAACAPGTDRIIVSTQVVEAGVDISASLLITELAPWASLVQRFGRSARWGGTARIVIVDLAAAQAQEALSNAMSKAKKEKKKKIDEEAIVAAAEEKSSLPYSLAEIRASREALGRLDDVSPLQLEKFEEEIPADFLLRLYPYEPRHLLLRHELEELFDTTPDLTGADIDISRFIRSGEERDLQVFWDEVTEKNPNPKLRPARDALCAVPFLKARDWLCGLETKTKKAPKLEPGKRAWVWDWLAGAWRLAERRDLYPGQTVLVALECRGYDPQKGWNPKSKAAIPSVSPPPLALDEQADAAQDDESLSMQTAWQTIATHGNEAARLVRSIAQPLAPNLVDVFDLGARCHDAGKIFPAFRGSIKTVVGIPDRPDLAKAPKDAWLSGKNLYPMPEIDGGGHRPGFRHELVSVLALFAVLQIHDPDHDAMLGPWRELFAKLNMSMFEKKCPESPPNSLEKEILRLDADHFNLLAYLIGCHHGKVRLAWHATPSDQAKVGGKPRLRGLEDGDRVDGVPLHDVAGAVQKLPAFQVDLCLATAGLNPKTGSGWTERCLGLLKKHGPFTLAWMEALLRAADQRASRLAITDPLLKQEVTS